MDKIGWIVKSTGKSLYIQCVTKRNSVRAFAEYMNHNVENTMKLGNKKQSDMK